MISRMLVQVRRAASRSPHEYWTRAMQRALILGERGRLLVEPRPSSSPSASTPGGRVALLSAASVLVPGVAALGDTVAALRDTVPEAEHDVLSRAARIERGEVPVMGFGWLDIGTEPNWLREPL